MADSAVKRPALFKASHIKALSTRHRGFRRLIASLKQPQFDIPAWKTIDEAILYAIIGQMLSTRAAHSIISKLTKRYEKNEELFGWAVKTARTPGPLHGVSQRKRRALAEWHLFRMKQPRRWHAWNELSLTEFRAEVCSIWGLGRWAADMLAIFFFARPDVWPETDGGIIRATKIHFDGATPSELAPRVTGYETLASLFLWDSLNRKSEIGMRRVNG